MSRAHKHRHNKKVGGKSFVILPILFFVGIFTVMYIAIAPAFGSLISAAGVMFSDGERDYSIEYKNIFVPVQENATVETVTNAAGEPEVKAEAVDFPHYSNQFAEIIIPDCDIECPLFMGDGDIALSNGAGIYYGSFLPGYGGTTLIAGHNNTFFNGLKHAAAGQEIIIRTSYGNYKYQIRETAVKEALDTTAYDLSADYENLILYTCYPFDEIGLTNYRFFVYADLIEGLPLEKTYGEGE